MTNTFRNIIMSSAALSLAVLPTLTAQAQEVQDEIIVTARKRAESLQSVPLAITAFTAQHIEDAGIDNVEDIALLTPGFVFAKLFGGGSSTPVIRGMSTSIGEPNVGFFVDGVYQSSRGIMDAMLGSNIERVEVAKGPQSALYGRNTFGGAINFVTKKPSDTLTGRAEITAGNGGHFEGRANISGPLVEDSVYFQLGGVHSKTSGFFTNGLTGDKLDSLESTILTGALMFHPNEDLEIVARVGYDTTRDGDYAQRFLVNNAAPANPTPAPLPDALQLFAGEITNFEDGFAFTPGHNHHDNLVASLRADLDYNGYTFTSIFGYNNTDIDNATDNDYEARSLRYTTNLIDQRELSQEFRIASPSDGAVRWVAGAYYYDLNTKGDNKDTFVDGALGLAAALRGSPLGGLLPVGIFNATTETTKSIALFGSIDVDISDQLTFTAEGRWTSEKKTANAVNTDPLTLVAAAPFNADKKFTNFVPRFIADYQATDNVMVYASVAKAIKAGGFNVITISGAIDPNDRFYDVESSWNYELGMKTILADGRATLNVAAFKTDWSDQIVRALSSSFSVLNANVGESTVKGVEVELQANIADGLDISGGFAYTDSVYDKYTFGALAGLGISPVLDGVRLQYVSEIQLNGSLQYTRPVSSDLDWKSRVDFAYQSDQAVVQTADAFTGDTTLVNVRTGVETDTWEILVWVENLFEEDSAIGGVFIPNQGSRFDTANGLVSPAPVVGFQAFNALSWSRNPRQWGVTARYKF